MIDDVTIALIRDRKRRRRADLTVTREQLFQLMSFETAAAVCFSGIQKKKKNRALTSGEERATSCSEAFTGRRCPHSFTECITAIFKDEVILSWVICEDICSVNRSWNHDVIQDVTSNSSDRIIAITCTEMPRHSWGRLMLLEPECS